MMKSSKRIPQLFGVGAVVALGVVGGAMLVAPAAQASPPGYDCKGGTDGAVPRYKTVCTDDAGNTWVFRFPNDGVSPSTITRTGPAGDCFVSNPASGPSNGNCGAPPLGPT